MAMQVYLNGSYIDHADAHISVDDRGFLFSDGIYEVVRIYGGKPFLMKPHMARLRAGLAALRIGGVDVDVLGDVARRLIEANQVTGDGMIYLQITRGVAPRKHAFPPADTKPTIYMFAKTLVPYSAEMFEKGVPAITVPDMRWSRCDIKSVSLLPNVLANQQAHEADAFEALFVKDGVLIEGSHSNLFGVLDGRLITYPKSNYILSGITRDWVLDLARTEAIAEWQEGFIPYDRISDVTELFLTGTTTEIMPVTSLDGRRVGDGTRGPFTTRVQEAYRSFISRQASSATSST
jgi:D-alanine transaminase